MGSQNTSDRDDSLFRMALIAVSVLLSMQVLRPFFVLVVYDFGEHNGLSLAAIPALIVFLTPFSFPCSPDY